MSKLIKLLKIATGRILSSKKIEMCKRKQTSSFDDGRYKIYITYSQGHDNLRIRTCKDGTYMNYVDETYENRCYTLEGRLETLSEEKRVGTKSGWNTKDEVHIHIRLIKYNPPGRFFGYVIESRWLGGGDVYGSIA